MTPDSMLTTQEMIHDASTQLNEAGWNAWNQRLTELEPELANFVDTRATVIAGRLALSGAPNAVTEGVFEDVMRCVLVAISALRQGHFQLWKDTEVGSRLLEIECSSQSEHEESVDSGDDEAPF